jgi:putative nucleotidyltransferase with HDIG domain
MKIHLPRPVHQLGAQFQDAGFQAFLVGGAVRNLLRREQPADFDIATDATPDQVMNLFRRVIPTGIKHGTVTVIYRNTHFEVTTFRSEDTYSDSRRPDSVRFVTSLEEDLERRDFTINAIAVNAVSGALSDPHDGRSDLKKHIIRAIGDPEKRFSEDGLRLLRACRFASQLAYTVEEETMEAMIACRSYIRAVSAERIREEIDKILRSPLPSVGFLVMERAGLLEEVLPELAACRGVEQKGDHEYDVLDHSLYSCDGAQPDNLTVRLAALFHDIGKPASKRRIETGEVVFHGHDEISAKLTRDILRRLKYSKAIENSVVHLIRQHMFAYDPSWTDSAVRRFLRRIGVEHVSNLFALRIADGYGVRRTQPSGLSVKELSRRIEDVLEKDQAIHVKDLAVSGHDLEREAGIPKGPEMGLVLDFLLETVIDDPGQNEHVKLIKLARNFYTRRIAPGN